MSEFTRIRRESQSNNKRDGLTGILVFGEGEFMQILEGTRNAISSAFSRISSDPMHSNIMLIHFSECSERLFGDWAMRHLTIRTEVLEQMTNFQEFEPRCWSSQECIAFGIEYKAIATSSVLQASKPSLVSAVE
ncbi:BLUF domain-containing protein [Rhodopirellula sp. JC740]|uniref:BLUF domain-containing protein n=2 Tax=Rhodopirellula halodulae TaxID=2894198 RepID=A0ABS8NN96_9BACT|nr:BLUF domain-containing protein [Rhodopirellula sp. JC740]